MRRLVFMIIVAGGCTYPDKFLVDADLPGDDGAPAIDGATDAVAIDAVAIDAVAIDAVTIDAPVDASTTAMLGQPCGGAITCLSSGCAASYVDSDDDGYGGASSAGMRCIGLDHRGNGYSDRTGDCCETDVMSNPGYMGINAVVNACGSWDWNCNGTIESNLPNTLPPCTMSRHYFHWNAGSPPACGSTADARDTNCSSGCQFCYDDGLVTNYNRCF